MGQPLKDRRRDPRYWWSPEDITQATLRPGCVVHVVDLSAGGALVQAATPLRPGARLHFHLVVRRQPFGLIYRGALQFEQRFEMRETATLIMSPVPIGPDIESVCPGEVPPGLMTAELL